MVRIALAVYGGLEVCVRRDRARELFSVVRYRRLYTSPAERQRTSASKHVSDVLELIVENFEVYKFSLLELDK